MNTERLKRWAEARCLISCPSAEHYVDILALIAENERLTMEVRHAESMEGNATGAIRRLTTELDRLRADYDAEITRRDEIIACSNKLISEFHAVEATRERHREELSRDI